MAADSIKVCFVCLGNICRSPTAEGVFRRLVHDAGLSEAFEIDSCGTGGWHAGDPPDARMQSAAKKHGFHLSGAARKVKPGDFEYFDWLIAMDRSNAEDLRRVGPAELHHKIRLLRDCDDPGAERDVPDPYYGGPSGFEEVVRIVVRCSRRLLAELSNAQPPARS